MAALTKKDARESLKALKQSSTILQKSVERRIGEEGLSGQDERVRVHDHVDRVLANRHRRGDRGNDGSTKEPDSWFTGEGQAPSHRAGAELDQGIG